MALREDRDPRGGPGRVLESRTRRPTDPDERVLREWTRAHSPRWCGEHEVDERHPWTVGEVHIAWGIEDHQVSPLADGGAARVGATTPDTDEPSQTLHSNL